MKIFSQLVLMSALVSSAAPAWASPVKYCGWISYTAYGAWSYDLEIQKASGSGMTGSEWVFLDLMNSEQKDFAQEQFASETRPLIEVIGDSEPGTGDSRHYRHDTIKVQQMRALQSLDCQ